MNIGAGLRVGDHVYRDPENELVGKCVKCKRHSLVITRVPSPPQGAQPKGFWKVPTE